jgi:hypothetical protein
LTTAAVLPNTAYNGSMICGFRSCVALKISCWTSEARSPYIFDSIDLITSGVYSKDSIYIYYFEDNVRKDIELVIHTDSISQKTIIYSKSIGWTSVSGFKDYFLQLNGIDIDTLYLNVEKHVDGCCTSHPFKTFKYNGQLIQIDNPDYIYVIKK